MSNSGIRWLAAGVAAFQVLALSQAGAQSIGVSFQGRSGGAVDLALTDVAGVVPQVNWANLPPNDGAGFDGAQGFLLASDGTETSVEFTWIANDAWNSNGGTGTPDEKMMKGIQKSNPDGTTFPDANSDMIFRWNNLLPGSTFNVIVYQEHNGGTAKSASHITGGSITNYIAQETTFGGTFIRGTATTTNGYATTANYVQFDNVSPDANGTIEIVVDKFIENPELADGMGVPGLQLVKLTGNWPVVTDPPTITQEIEDRYGNTTDILSVVGNDVTLNLGIDGPWDVEWFKNGGSVASGTETSYTLATTAGDKDATIYAVVSNPIGSVTSLVVTLELDDPLPAQLIQGFMRGEHYGNISGTIVYPDLYNHPAFQTRTEDYEFFTLGGDVAPTNPDDSNFGRVFEGWVVPTTTEDYNFFGNSDDAFELFINPTGGTAGALPALETAFSRLPDATETSWQNRYVYFAPGAGQTTPAFPLIAGEYYGFVMLYKEGTGGDHASVAWRAASDSTPVANLRPIGPENVFCLASPAGNRGAITNHPQSVTVLQNRTATFTVGAATRPRANEFAVQWTKNGVNIPAATGPTYTTGLVTLGEDQDVYQAKVYTVAGLQLSDPATLTVDPDNVAPDATSAGGYPGTNIVGLVFSEAMGSVITNTGRYAVSGVTVTGVELLGDGDNVVALTLSGAPAPGATVTVSGVADLAGNPIGNGLVTIEDPDLAATVLVRTASTNVPPVITDPANPGRSIPLGGGSMYIEAGGSDIWDAADSGHGAYRSFTGPFRAQVRVQSLAGPDNWTKATLDVRETSAGGSRHVNIVTTRTGGQNQMSFDRRDTTGGGSGSSGDDGTPRAGPVPYPNAWLRIDRPDATSNTFDSYLSTDGVNWTLHHSHTVPGAILPETLLVGVAATAHNNASTLAEALFRDFTVVPLAVVAHPKVTAFGISGGNVTLDWQDGGEAETAPEVDGPWTPTGDSDGSYTEPLGTYTQRFFRANPQP